MQFINECEPNLNVGVLAQFNENGLIAERTDGRIIGIVSRVYQVQTSLDDPTLMNVAEVTSSGSCNNVILSGSASWQGCNLYASGAHVSAIVDDDSIGVLVPRTLGEDKVDFQSGDLVTVVMS